jgi:hypothetical protein
MTRLYSSVCDDAGNVYTIPQGEESFRDPLKRETLPFQKITPAGDLAGSFQVADAFTDDVYGRNGGVVSSDFVGHYDFFVTADGARAFQAAYVHGETFVVEFAQNGSVKAKTKLLVGPDDRHMQPWHLAVFKSGEYLVIGFNGLDRLTPFTAVFAADGRMVKKIYEPEDEEARLQARPDNWHGIDRGGNGGIDFVRGGGVAAGSDGNVYLLHGTTSYALVYVISPAGEVVRKLRIDSGDSDLVARSIRSYAGRLAIEFDDNWAGAYRRNLIKVTDLQGNSIADYKIGTVGDHFLYLAGYGPDGLTFMPYDTDNEDKLFFVKTKLP